MSATIPSDPSSPSRPRQNPKSPLKVDPAYTNFITESPQSTSTSHVYPPLAIPTSSYPSPYLPRTPTGPSNPTIEDSFSQLGSSETERDFPTISQASRAPLLPVKEKDFADANNEEGPSTATRDGGRSIDKDYRGTASPGRYSRLQPTTPVRSLTPKQPIPDPPILPRPGPEDAYIGQFLAPFPGSGRAASPDATDRQRKSSLRPSAPRSTSAPGLPQTPSSKESDVAHPLFQIFSAQLDVSAEEMVRRLKGHLGEVLKVQEEVGGMHLKLEGLGMGIGIGEGTGVPMTAGIGTSSPGKGSGEEKMDDQSVKAIVDRREKGVEEIMEKLGNLSNTLRQYHQLGTPTLTFPPTSKSSSMYPNLNQPPLTPLSSTASGSPVASSSRSPTRITKLQSPPKIRSPKAAPSEGRKAFSGIPNSPPQKHTPKIHSNLDQVTTADEAEDEDGDEDQEQGDRRISALGRQPSSLSGNRGREKKYQGDVWLEGNRADVGETLASPMEMADRSRPW